MDLYASIYVKTTLSESELATIVAGALDAEADSLGNIETPALSVSVRQQPDAEGPYFGEYNFLVEFDPSNTGDSNGVVSTLASLLERLWAAGIRTETSCDYESQLLHRGRFDGSTGTPIVYGGEDQ